MRHILPLLLGHVLPVSVTLPSAATRDPPPQKPEEEDQEQGQGQSPR